MADIFISYKREEADKAAQLAGTFEQLGFSVWWDCALLSGDEFRHVIREMIDKSMAVIVLWSPLSVQSKFVVDEAGYALQKDKLLPVFLTKCDLPFGFGSHHADDLTKWNGEASHIGFAGLLKSVEKKLDKKARFDGRSGSTETQKAEMAAFQTAAKLNSAPAWVKFLQDYPGSGFRGFIETHMGDGASQAAPADASRQSIVQTELPSTPPETTARPLNRKFVYPLLAGMVVIGIVLGGVLIKAGGTRSIEKQVIEKVDEEKTPTRVLTREDQAWALVKKMDTRAGYKAFHEIYSSSSYKKDPSHIPKNEDNTNVVDLENRGNEAGALTKYGEAAIYHQQAAVLGHAQSQLVLATEYYSGINIPLSHEKSVYWNRLVAEQGYAAGQNSLGFMYRHGLGGLTQSDERALSLFRQAAAQGDPVAQSNIGTMYELGFDIGDGHEQSDSQAAIWYRRSAELNWGFSQLKIAEMYETGRGVPQSNADAIIWYRRAAAQGSDVAKRALRSLEAE